MKNCPQCNKSPNLVALLWTIIVAAASLSYLDVETETHAQCDQIGLFLKYLGNIFSCKSGPNVWRLFCLFSKMALLIKNCFVNFCVFFGKIGLLFIPTSSLTDLTCGPHSMKCFNKPNCFYK